MVAPEREKLRGTIEMDETWVGGLQAGLKGSRQLKGRKAALVIVAIERRGTGIGRVRMEVIPDFARATMNAFALADRLTQAVEDCLTGGLDERTSSSIGCKRAGTPPKQVGRV
jgi:hypothetical protein